MPPPTPAVVAHCLELFAVLGEASAKRMFGGWGLRIDGIFVALIAGEQLYLKADAQSAPQLAAAGSEPFVYTGGGKRVTMSYWSAPAQALDGPQAMRPWARLALDAALRAAARSPAPRHGRVRK